MGLVSLVRRTVSSLAHGAAAKAACLAYGQGSKFRGEWFGILFAVPMAAIWLIWRNQHLHGITPTYLALAAIAGLAQIFGTTLLIASFGHRGFVVGTAFSETEALQTALCAAIFMGERLAPLAWTGVIAGLSGVVVLALAGRDLELAELPVAFLQTAALCGLGAAALFAITGLLVKKAAGPLGGYEPISAALITLVAVMAARTFVHDCWIAAKEPATFAAIGRTWKSSASVGLLSALGSAC